MNEEQPAPRKKEESESAKCLQQVSACHQYERMIVNKELRGQNRAESDCVCETEREGETDLERKKRG